MPSETSFFQIDSFAAFGSFGAFGAFGAFALRENEISFFSTDCLRSASPSCSAFGSCGAFGLRESLISFFRNDCVGSSKASGSASALPFFLNEISFFQIESLMLSSPPSAGRVHRLCRFGLSPRTGDIEAGAVEDADQLVGTART